MKKLIATFSGIDLRHYLIESKGFNEFAGTVGIKAYLVHISFEQRSHQTTIGHKELALFAYAGIVCFRPGIYTLNHK